MEFTLESCKGINLSLCFRSCLRMKFTERLHKLQYPSNSITGEFSIICFRGNRIQEFNKASGKTSKGQVYHPCIPAVF